ncbi:hypothetical protein Hanom_Chr17g01581631 [Helianthus anomalus]
MLNSDTYHSSHYGGYARDELLLSLQLRFKVLSRRVLELELTPRPSPCLCQYTMNPHTHHCPHLQSHLLLLHLS